MKSTAGFARSMVLLGIVGTLWWYDSRTGGNWKGRPPTP